MYSLREGTSNEIIQKSFKIGQNLSGHPHNNKFIYIYTTR